MPFDTSWRVAPTVIMSIVTKIDREWIVSALTQFVEDLKPKNNSFNDSSMAYITSHNSPACGREAAIAHVEKVRPILDRMYPSWREENNEDEYFEFAQERDAAQRLIARIATEDEVLERLGDVDDSPNLSASELHLKVWAAARPQWDLGNHADAVDAVARYINSMLQAKIGRKDLSDLKLVQEVFSDKAPVEGKSRLRFPDVGGEETQDSMRRGVMSFGAGCFGAIRNPLAHLPDHEVDLTEQEALERLAAWSLFARWIDQATIEHSD